VEAPQAPEPVKPVLDEIKKLLPAPVDHLSSSDFVLPYPMFRAVGSC